MKSHQLPGFAPSDRCVRRSRTKTGTGDRSRSREAQGFTLVELLIVVTILPLIVGALSVGLISVFSLQPGVANRLADTGDAQVVNASYVNDVQSAAYITTDGAATPMCGTGKELLGLEWNPNTSGGGFQTVVSYISVPVTSGSTTTYSLVRQYCTGNSLTPASVTIISNDLSFGQGKPNLWPPPADTAAKLAWISTQGVTSVTFPITEPNSKFSYTLVAAPAASTSLVSPGAPIVTTTTTSCGFASPGTGTYAATLCFVDFSALNNQANYNEASNGGCLSVSVLLPGNYTMYFCIAISGNVVSTTSLSPNPMRAVPFPTWSNSFLGNNCYNATDSTCTNGIPFYTGVHGDPGLYTNGSGTETVTISQISVLNPQGVLATGWQVVGADAESTDQSESISWTSDKALKNLPNGQIAGSPYGNACDGSLPITNNGLTITCAVPSGVNVGFKTGTPMVWALTPTTLTTTLGAGGLEAMAFGLLLS